MKSNLFRAVSLCLVITTVMVFSNTKTFAFNNTTDSLNSEKDTLSIAPTKEKKTTTSLTMGPGNWFGKTLKADTPAGKFKVKASLRAQARYALDTYQDEFGNTQHEDELYFRRARAKLDGYLFTSDLVYKFEYDLVNQQVLDLALKYQLFDGFWIWAGQTKLPGNRERVVSSQNLQFVDRSLLNSYYTSDRDLGIQLRYTHKTGNGIVFNEAFAVSTGEGKNFYAVKDYDQIFKPYPIEEGSQTIENGLNYMGRIEMLPFGKFSSKGDYKFADFAREKTPKLAIGASYEVNQDAIRSKGQRGSVLSESRTLNTVFADAILKYNGVTAFASYAYKTTKEGNPVVLDDPANDAFETFQTGQAFNIQAGYLFKNNFELSARTTLVRPEAATQQSDIEEYTIAVSKYIVKHYLKVQTDFSYRNIHGEENIATWRLQMEFGF